MARVLTEVRLRNLKALAEASIPLSRLTILVGANGTGKSTVLRAIHDLSRVIDRAREGSDSPVEGVFAGSDHHTAIRTRRAVEGRIVSRWRSQMPAGYPPTT
jgi:predicted ATPase